MTDANVTNEPVSQETGDSFVSETERKSEVLASSDFPPSLISYFETSKSRATVCEKLILEEVEDFTTSYEDLMNLPTELNKNRLKLNEQINDISVKVNENTFADSCLFPEAVVPVIANVTASPRNDDEAETDDYGESEKHMICTSRLFEFSLTKEEIKEDNEHQQAQKEKRHFEELKKEEQIRQRENDFQMELKKLMEAEKLHQIELQLMEKRAQDKLEQELLLQQELISNLQKQVEEERRMMAEELRRMKEEGEKKRKEEEEKIKREKQRMEEEIRRKKMEEENKKILEMRAEEERRLKEEQRKREDEEERRKREEVRIKMEEEKRKREEEDRKRREEEKIKREMQRRKMEEEMRRKKMEEENKKILEMRAEEERRLKEEQRKREEEEERRKREEVRLKMEEEMRRKKEEDRKITEVEPSSKEEEEEEAKREEVKGRVEEEMKKNKVEIKTDECKKKIWLKEEKMNQMKQMETETNAKKMENKSNPKVQKEEEEAGKTVMKVTGKNIKGRKEKTNEDDIRNMKEWRKEEGKATPKENERRDTEVTKELEVKTQGHEEEMKEKKPEEERRETMTTDEEKLRIVDGMQLSEDKRRKGLKNKVIRKEEEKIIQEEENDDQEEIRSNEEKEIKGKIRKDDRNIEQESEREKKTEEEVMENKEENLKAEGRWHNKEDGSKIIRVQEETVTGSSSMKSRTERETTGGAGSSLTSPMGDSTWSSGLRASVAEACVDQQDAGVQLCSSSTSSPLKRLSWMKGCISWCKLSLQNRRKHKGSLRGGRLPRRLETSVLPPLCPDTLLQATGCRTFQQVTSVTLEDLPGCSVSSLALCSHLQSLTLRRCGLTSLEGISQLAQLCYVDVMENHISFVACEDMTSLRVLRLGYNKLTSIHGLRGADNLDELELSHNNITRIAGLESMRRLQRLSVDHNQLISTKGLRDVYTLLHLNCSHNHLAGVEGLENNALLQTLDLRSNSLSEPPSLDNHVLLRELHLDDNSISSLQALAAACWLPLMQNLSVAQNRITRLPSMSDFVSLANLDLQFNCMSELHNVCESLEGCLFLQHVHLRGNPLQQENGWRPTLQKALPGLRAIDEQQTDCCLSPPPAVQQISSASDTFLNFCQAQLQQMNDLVQQHRRELSEASSSLDAVKNLCRHFAETLKLAEDQRFAHEYGDITASEGRTDTQSTTATKLTEDAQMESSERLLAVSPSRSNVNSSWTFKTSPTESWLQSSDGGLNSPSEKRTTSSSDFKMAALSNQDLDLKNSAAVVIQQQWRRYRQDHGDISRRPLAASGDGANPEPGPSCVIHSVVDQHNAAAVIQASWRGFSVRRRLTSALAAVTFPSTREDDTFEEVDMDEFVFDEAELEKHWTLQLSDESLSRHEPVSEQPRCLKFPGPLPEPHHNTHPTHPVWRPKQAWVPEEEEEEEEEEVDPAGRDSPESSHRKSPASSSVLSGISQRSEKILEEWGFTDSHTALQMLKRAQNMKWKQQHKKKHKDPSVRPALFYQLVPVEAENRAAPRSRNHRRGALCRTEQQPERTEPVKQESAQQRLHGQSDRSSESERFLPELSSDILNGGRVQLVADPVYSERHRASGQRANSASCAQQHSRYPHRISLGQATTDAPSPNRVAAAPSIKERISFRDNPVQLSGGWGGGKKRNSIHK